MKKFIYFILTICISVNLSACGTKQEIVYKGAALEKVMPQKNSAKELFSENVTVSEESAPTTDELLYGNKYVAHMKDYNSENVIEVDGDDYVASLDTLCGISILSVQLGDTMYVTTTDSNGNKKSYKFQYDDYTDYYTVNTVNTIPDLIKDMVLESETDSEWIYTTETFEEWDINKEDPIVNTITVDKVTRGITKIVSDNGSSDYTIEPLMNHFYSEENFTAAQDLSEIENGGKELRESINHIYFDWLFVEDTNVKESAE